MHALYVKNHRVLDSRTVVTRAQAQPVQPAQPVRAYYQVAGSVRVQHRPRQQSDRVDARCKAARRPSTVQIPARESQPQRKPQLQSQPQEQQQKQQPQVVPRAWRHLFELCSEAPVLGGGAFAEVFKVRCRRTSQWHALKVMNRPNFELRGIGQQIEAEVRAMKLAADAADGTKAENYVVRLLNVVEEDDYVFLLMELCGQGDFLRQLHSEPSGRFEEATVAVLAQQLFKGLKMLHDNGIIHRDIKPDNLLNTDCGSLKIADFGWCANARDAPCALAGTFQYMAPEVLQNKPQTVKVDVWSAGVTLYHMLIGRPLLTTYLGPGATQLSQQDPYEATAMKQRMLLEEILKTCPLRKQDCPPGITKNCWDFLAGLLTPEASQRMSVEQALGHTWMPEAKDAAVPRLPPRLIPTQPLLAAPYASPPEDAAVPQLECSEPLPPAPHVSPPREVCSLASPEPRELPQPGSPRSPSRVSKRSVGHVPTPDAECSWNPLRNNAYSPPTEKEVNLSLERTPEVPKQSSPRPAAEECTPGFGATSSSKCNATLPWSDATGEKDKGESKQRNVFLVATPVRKRVFPEGAVCDESATALWDATTTASGGEFSAMHWNNVQQTLQQVNDDRERLQKILGELTACQQSRRQEQQRRLLNLAAGSELGTVRALQQAQNHCGQVQAHAQDSLAAAQVAVAAAAEVTARAVSDAQQAWYAKMQADHCAGAAGPTSPAMSKSSSYPGPPTMTQRQDLSATMPAQPTVTRSRTAACRVTLQPARAPRDGSKSPRFSNVEVPQRQLVKAYYGKGGDGMLATSISLPPNSSGGFVGAPCLATSVAIRPGACGGGVVVTTAPLSQPGAVGAPWQRQRRASVSPVKKTTCRVKPPGNAQWQPGSGGLRSIGVSPIREVTLTQTPTRVGAFVGSIAGPPPQAGVCLGSSFRACAESSTPVVPLPPQKAMLTGAWNRCSSAEVRQPVTSITVTYPAASSPPMSVYRCCTERRRQSMPPGNYVQRLNISL